MTITTFSTPIKNAGSKMATINVSRDNAPFGQIWTWETKGERHGWHVKTLTGAYQHFQSANKKIDLVDAMIWASAQ